MSAVDTSVFIFAKNKMDGGADNWEIRKENGWLYFLSSQLLLYIG
jgi:hypothetical protein